MGRWRGFADGFPPGQQRLRLLADVRFLRARCAGAHHQAEVTPGDRLPQLLHGLPEAFVLNAGGHADVAVQGHHDHILAA